VAERVGRELGVDRVYAEQSPEQKLEVVRRVAAEPDLRQVIMVGDGINDAPALAIADLGIAMGAAGATVSSETADAVITVDRIDRVADAIHTCRRALHIARQSVLTGMGLSIAAMGVAAFGHLPPIAGALFQEAVDLAVILNAASASRVRPGARGALSVSQTARLSCRPHSFGATDGSEHAIRALTCARSLLTDGAT
jgi:cation transport ATPase